MLSQSDLTALGLVGTLLFHKNAICNLAIDYGLKRDYISDESKTEMNKHIEQMSYIFQYLEMWFSGEDISTVFLDFGEFSGNPNLEDKGLLTIIRDLCKKKKQLDVTLQSLSNIEDMWPYIEKYQKFEVKSLLMMQL